MGKAETSNAQSLADPERDGTLFVRALSGIAQPPDPPDVTVRRADANDMGALRAAMDATGLYSPHTVQERLSAGRQPYVVAAASVVLTYGWVAFSAEPIGDLGIAFLLDPGEAYIYDCATRPEQRGRGYYAALLRFMAYDLARDGLGRAWIGTAPGNIVSQRGIARAGFAKVADVRIDRRPGADMSIQLLGVPGVDRALLEHAAWCFHGRPVPYSF